MDGEWPRTPIALETGKEIVPKTEINQIIADTALHYGDWNGDHPSSDAICFWEFNFFFIKKKKNLEISQLEARNGPDNVTSIQRIFFFFFF